MRAASIRDDLLPMSWRRRSPCGGVWLTVADMRPRRPAWPGASKAIGAIAAGPFLVAALCLAGALAAFLVYPLMPRGDGVSSLQPHRGDSGRRGHPELVVSGPGRCFRHGLRGPAATPEGGRGRPAGPGGGHRFHGHDLHGRHGKRAGGPVRLPGQGSFAAARRARGPTTPASTCPRKATRRDRRRLPGPEASPSNHRMPKRRRVPEVTSTKRRRRWRSPQCPSW